jgi:hypothetical protein
VLNVEESGTSLSRRSTLGDVSEEPIFGVLNEQRTVLLVIVRVDVEVDSVNEAVSFVFDS